MGEGVDDMSHSRALRRSSRPVALCAAVALVVVACGGDEPAEEPAEEPTEEPAEEPMEEPAEEPAAEEESSAEGEAAAEEAFYEGVDIRYMVPTSPGGGADAIAQFLNPYWTEHLPGNPSVTVDYQPGAGGIAGANEFALRAETDGSAVMQGTLSSATAFLLGEEEVEYNMGDWNPIIAFSTSGVIYASPDTGIESVADVVDYEGDDLFIGGRAPTASDIMHILAMEVLGFRDNVDHIWGYGGTGEQLLAFEQGETNMDGTTDNAWLENGQRLQEEGLAVPILAYGTPNDEGGFDRHPQIDAPTVDEAYRDIHGEEPSGPAWEAFQTVMDVMQVATVVVLPEGAPEEARQAWRQAVDEMVNETDFVEQFTANLNPNEPIHQEERLEASREALGSIDPEVQSWIRDFLEENYPEQLG